MYLLVAASAGLPCTSASIRLRVLIAITNVTCCCETGYLQACKHALVRRRHSAGRFLALWVKRRLESQHGLRCSLLVTD